MSQLPGELGQPSRCKHTVLEPLTLSVTANYKPTSNVNKDAN